MPNLVIISDFVGELDISNSTTSNSARIQWFINKYEPKFIGEMLGDWKEYQDAIVEEPIADNWQELQSKLKPLIACFIYYWYQRDAATKTTGLGEKKPKGENSDDASAAGKMVRAWNEMATGMEDIYKFLNERTDAYPGWTYCAPYVPYINTLGL